MSDQSPAVSASEHFQNFVATLGAAWKLITGLLLTGLLAAASFGIWRYTRPNPLMQKKPVSAPVKNWHDVDLTDEENMLAYLDVWIRHWAPYILEKCIPEKIAVEDCRAEKFK